MNSKEKAAKDQLYKPIGEVMRAAIVNDTFN